MQTPVNRNQPASAQLWHCPAQAGRVYEVYGVTCVDERAEAGREKRKLFNPSEFGQRLCAQREAMLCLLLSCSLSFPAASVLFG